MKRKLLSALLCLSMALTLLPAAALAGEQTNPAATRGGGTNTTTPSEGGTETPATPAKPDVIEAPLEDHSEAALEADALISDYQATAGGFAAVTDQTYKTVAVKVSGSNLKEHLNSDTEGSKYGYWAGIGIKDTDEAETEKYVCGWGTYTPEDSPTLVKADNRTEGGYNTFYFNLDPTNPSNKNKAKTAYVAVYKKAADGGDSGTYDTLDVIYNITFEVTLQANVIPAPLVDHPVGDDTAKEGLETNYKAEGGALTEKSGVKYIDVEVTADSLKEHRNSGGNLGYWAGIGIPSADAKDTQKYVCGWGTYTPPATPTLAAADNRTEEGYDTFYFDLGPGNANNTAGAKKGYVAVYEKAADAAADAGYTELTTVYNIDFSGVTLAANVIPAPLEDHSGAGLTGDQLISNYKITNATAPKKTGSGAAAYTSVDVAVSGRSLKEHQNSGKAVGYWAGIGIPSADEKDTQKYICGWGPYSATAVKDKTADKADNRTEEGYDTFYFNLGPNDNNPQKLRTAYVAVYAKASEDAEAYTKLTAVYNIDFDMTLDGFDTPELTIALLTDETAKDKKVLGAAPDTLNKGIKLEQKGQTVTVTGSADYIASFPEFDGENTANQKGHYLALRVATSGAWPNGYKVGLNNSPVEKEWGTDAFFSDGKDDTEKETGKIAFVVLRLDDAKTDERDGKFTLRMIPWSTDDEAVTYTIDFSGLTLLPEVEEGTTVEAKPGENGKPGTVEITTEDAAVAVPDNTTATVSGESKPLALGEMKIEVSKVANNSGVETAAGTNEKVASAIQGNGSKIVKVTATATVTTEAGTSETKTLFTEGTPLRRNPISVTIKGLTQKTYYVFCIKDPVDGAAGGKVLYYGSKELKGEETSLTFQTTHLCHFAAVEETEDLKKAVQTMTVEAGTGLTGSADISTGGGGGGGGGGSSSGATVKPATGGKVTTSPSNPKQGDKVTLTPKPSDGYEVDTIVVKDSKGKELTVTKNSDGTFSFTMPAGRVTITPTFKKVEAPAPASQFSDVSSGDWFAKAAEYVTDKGIMTGVGGGKFAPQTTTSRAMLVQMLYALEGKPAAGGSTFSDVRSGDWFASAAAWASANGIVNGVGEGKFGPNQNLTREQMALILYGYAKSKGYDVSPKANLSAYADQSSASSWATEALAWAVGAGLISGRTSTTLAPGGAATRAEMAQIMMQFCEKVAK